MTREISVAIPLGGKNPVALAALAGTFATIPLLHGLANGMGSLEGHMCQPEAGLQNS